MVSHWAVGKAKDAQREIAPPGSESGRLDCSHKAQSRFANRRAELDSKKPEERRNHRSALLEKKRSPGPNRPCGSARPGSQQRRKACCAELGRRRFHRTATA